MCAWNGGWGDFLTQKAGHYRNRKGGVDLLAD